MTETTENNESSRGSLRVFYLTWTVPLHNMFMLYCSPHLDPPTSFVTALIN